MWLPDHLSLTLMPQRVYVEQCGLCGLGRRKLFALQAVPNESEPTWQASINSVQSWFANQAQSGKETGKETGKKSSTKSATRTTVYVSEQFVRYQLLPWQAGLVSSQEWLAYARHRFVEVYGEQASRWQISVETVSPGQAAIAMAIEHDLFDALMNLRSHGAKVVSLQSRWVALMNQNRRLIGKQADRREGCWVVLIEPTQISYALIQRGQVQCLRSEGVNLPSQMSLDLQMKQHELMLACAEKVTQVFYSSGDCQLAWAAHSNGRNWLPMDGLQFENSPVEQGGCAVAAFARGGEST